MPTPTTAADVLRAAADLLDEDPARWGRDYWLDPATGCRCSGGLIALAIAPDDPDGDPHALPKYDGSRALGEAAIELFEAHVEAELFDRYSPDGVQVIGEPLIGLWNDKVATGPAHVAATMRAAADAARCPTCRGAGGWQHRDGLIVECPRGCMTGGAA